jgi:hypothetical protein
VETLSVALVVLAERVDALERRSMPARARVARESSPRRGSLRAAMEPGDPQPSALEIAARARVAGKEANLAAKRAAARRPGIDPST